MRFLFLIIGWFGILLLLLDKLESVKGALSNWGKKAAEATKRAEDLAGNMWQHCKYF